MFSVQLDHNLIAIIVQFCFFVWFLSGLNQRVKDLEKGFAESSRMDKEIKDELHTLSLVVARSDEKLVHLVTERIYGNGVVNVSNSQPNKRRAKQVPKPV